MGKGVNLKIGTLFSGIGSPEQAASRVWKNHEIAFACEWDKHARQSYKAIYEIDDEHFFVDVREMDGTKYQGKCDILIGGSPCQAFSIAGLRQGTDDERGQLIYQYVRIVEEVKASVIVYENVKGMLSIDKGRTVKQFMQALRQIGYYCQYSVLNTKDYGVPQNRERLFMVGFLDHEAYYRFQFAEKIPLVKRLRDFLEPIADDKYYLNGKTIEMFTNKTNKAKADGNGFAFKPQDGDKIAFAITTKAGQRINDNYIKERLIVDTKSPDDLRAYSEYSPTLQANDYKEPKKVLEGVVGMLDTKDNECNRRVYGTDGTAPCLQTMQGGNREPKIICLNQEGEPMPNVPENGQANRIYSKNDITPALNIGWQPKTFEKSYRIRKLTPLECWRLQDFPNEAHEKAKQAGVSDSQRYKQAGNSMTVAVVEMIFRQIDKALKGE